MRWSWHLARISGIDVKVHATFLLIVLIGALQWGDSGMAGMAFGAGLVLLLFTCVTLHEFGHALVAQRLGIRVREIVLLPIGGMAVLSRNPSRPMHELLIAAAGPLVNVGIIGVLLVVLGARASLSGLDPRMMLASVGSEPSLLGALSWLLNANIALVLFNMIPAFPLDGGRILRAILGFFMEWVRATRIAAATGQVLAVALGVGALMSGHLLLVVIAAFIFLGAGATHAEEQARTLLATLRVGDAYNKHALTLSEDDRVSKVAEYLLTSYQPDFAVMRGRELQGVVLREDVLKALAEEPRDIPVLSVMRRHFANVQAGMTIDQVREALQEAESRVAAVYDGRSYLGLVSAEDIAEAYAVYTFMQRQDGAGADRPTQEWPTVGGPPETVRRPIPVG